MAESKSLAIPWEETKDEVLSAMICPGCKSYFKAPIYFCLGGHSICDNCKTKGIACITCGQAVSQYQNLSLAAVVAGMKLPVACKHLFRGCNVKESQEELAKHEMKCEYRDVACGLPSCTVTPQFKDLNVHWKSHGGQDGKWTKVGQYLSMKTWINEDLSRFAAFVYNPCTNQASCVYCRRPQGVQITGNWKVWVTMVADPETSTEYRCEVRLSSVDGKSTQAFNGEVNSCEVPFQSIPMDKCLSITSEQFQFYNGNLTILDFSRVDKLGELIFPFSVQIRKRELNVGDLKEGDLKDED